MLNVGIGHGERHDVKRHIERAAHIAKAQSRLGSINRCVAAGCEIDKVTSAEIAFVIFIAKCQAQPADGRWRRVWVACKEDVPFAPPCGGKNINYRFSRFFVRSVPLFRSLMLTPMHYEFLTVLSPPNSVGVIIKLAQRAETMLNLVTHLTCPSTLPPSQEGTRNPRGGKKQSTSRVRTRLTCHLDTATSVGRNFVR